MEASPALHPGPWHRCLPIRVGVTAFIDYDAVFRSIGSVSFLEWVVLLVVASIRFIPEGWIYVAAQPGLTTRQGMQLFLVAETLSNVPPGGLDLISCFQMTRSWGFSAASSTSATIAS